MIRTSNSIKDYALIDSGDKEKLELYNGILLRRPDPIAIWPKDPKKPWNKAAGHYHRSNKGGGHWEFKEKLKSFWFLHYRECTFKVSPTDFKHTGLFPEQAVNWDWMTKLIQQSKRSDLKILNLFAYTGGATMACASAGAYEVVHVDAAKHMVSWAKENAKYSNLESHRIRYIVDDCMKFVARELRRGNKYDAIIMDPPSYGRGPNNEVWKIEDSLIPLLQNCVQLLSDHPLFFLVNSYTTALSAQTIQNSLLKTLAPFTKTGVIETKEIGIMTLDSNLVLPCGVSGRWCQHEDNL